MLAITTSQNIDVFTSHDYLECLSQASPIQEDISDISDTNLINSFHTIFADVDVLSPLSADDSGVVYTQWQNYRNCSYQFNHRQFALDIYYIELKNLENLLQQQLIICKMKNDIYNLREIINNIVDFNCDITLSHKKQNKIKDILFKQFAS